MLSKNGDICKLAPDNSMAIKVEKIHSFKGHEDCVYTLEPANRENLFFSGAGDGMVVLWDLNKPDLGELIAKLPNSVYALHLHAASNYLIAGHNYEGIHILDWQNKKEVASLKITDAAIFALLSIDNILFVGTGSGEVILINIKNVQVVEKIKVSEKSIRAFSFNPIKNELAIGASDNHITVLDVEHLQVKHKWEAHVNSVFSLQYTPNFDYLISTSRDARIKVWDVRGGYAQVNEVVAHLFAINHLSFRADGRYFATCSMDKSIKVWDAAEQRLLKVIDKSRHAGHGTSVNRLWWSSYQNLLVSASDDRTISVWNIIFE
jgi:WD40 repeat protein